jgi:hypothetical protein
MIEAPYLTVNVPYLINTIAYRSPYNEGNIEDNCKKVLR